MIAFQIIGTVLPGRIALLISVAAGGYATGSLVALCLGYGEERRLRRENREYAERLAALRSACQEVQRQAARLRDWLGHQASASPSPPRLRLTRSGRLVEE